MNNLTRTCFQWVGPTVCNRFSLLAFLFIAAPLTAHALTLGQIDNFQGGTALNWQTGHGPGSTVATGGPAGAGDQYLQVVSTGTGGTDSRLVIFNSTQWVGNYTGAGITTISMDLDNFSASPLSIRLALFVNAATGYSSTTPFTLAANSGWQHATFTLSAANFTAIGAPTAFNTLLSNFTGQLRILDSSAPSIKGDDIAATLGADNIQAIPEPSTIFMVGLGSSVLLFRRRK